MEFEEIYKTYWQKIFRLCMGYVNDSDLAKDLAQDTFVTVWQQLSSFRNESAVGTWIFRIATNNCLKNIERSGRMERMQFSHEVENENSGYSETEIVFLYKCISELPEIDRIIISLELEDVKQSEIASITGLSESNIRVKIHRIKEKLTEKFKQYER
jgi:RNA polymerase sigma-70 factor (ECF subfamily)